MRQADITSYIDCKIIDCIRHQGKTLTFIEYVNEASLSTLEEVNESGIESHEIHEKNSKR